MGIPKLWGRKPGGVERGFVYSHVLTTYYNWKNKVLLKDKLDDMDRLIAEHGEAIAQKLVTNEKFAETLAGYVTKAMMTGQDVDNANTVPNSAFIHTLAQKITENQTAISELNSAIEKFTVYNWQYQKFDFNSTGYNAGLYKVGPASNLLNAPGGFSTPYAHVIILKEYTDTQAEIIVPYNSPKIGFRTATYSRFSTEPWYSLTGTID